MVDFIIRFFWFLFFFCIFVCVDLEEPKQLIGGNDFYAFPRIDPRGKRIVWMEWSHPNMPWDRSQIWVGYFSENGYFN